ncbi:MAG TPA: hypothetical protein VKG80_05060 [Trebonia sp.]|nr:hypothetical protein [Trebonia sp.]
MIASLPSKRAGTPGLAKGNSLHDGRDVTAKATARKKGPRPQTLAAIRQAAEHHVVKMAGDAYPPRE